MVIEPSTREVCRIADVLYNFTNATYTVYDSNGELRAVPPDKEFIFPEPPGTKFYIVDESTYFDIKQRKMYTRDLVKALPNNTGRSEVNLARLTLYDDQTIFIYPAGK